MTDPTLTDEREAEPVHVAFSGDVGALTGIAHRGDIQTFVVRAKARENKETDRKDGEVRRTIGFTLLSVEPGEVERIEPDPQLPFSDAEEI